MVDVVKLLEYSQYLRHRYLETLSKLSWEEFVKDRGASFSSLRNIFLHCIVCIDFIQHLLQGDISFTRINYDDYYNIERITEYMECIESEFNTYLSKLTPKELSRRVERKERDGTVVVSTVEDNLVHLFQEEIHHIGELMALLWQMDISPPFMGWNQYLSLKK